MSKVSLSEEEIKTLRKWSNDIGTVDHCPINGSCHWLCSAYFLDRGLNRAGCYCPILFTEKTTFKSYLDKVIEQGYYEIKYRR